MKEGVSVFAVLRRPAVLVGLVALFFAGLGAGWLVFSGAGGVGTVLGDRGEGVAETGVGASRPGQPTLPDGPPGVPQGAGSGETLGAERGAERGAAAPTGPSDRLEAAVPPSEADSPDPPEAPDFLAANFGLAAAPAIVAGMARIGEPVVEGDTVRAEYSGGEAGQVDLLFLSVVRAPSPEDARAEADMLIHAFPAKAITYVWGGREVRQAMNDEGRPDQFPPLISFVWRDGPFAVRVVAAPLAPDRVEDARRAALAFIGDLPY